MLPLVAAGAATLGVTVGLLIKVRSRWCRSCGRVLMA